MAPAPDKFKNPTRAYRPSGAGAAGLLSAYLDGSPTFTWWDVPRMLRDPQVQFGLRMWRSPFQQVKWKVAATDPRVARFVDATLRRAWGRHLPRLLSRYSEYGFAAAGAEFVRKRGLVRLDKLTVADAADVRPLAWAKGPRRGFPAGFAFTGAGAGGRVLAPHAVWFAGRREYGEWYDRPVLAGAYEPWAEKRGRGGAVQSRQKWFRKNAYSGGTVRHPDGVSNLGSDETPEHVNNQDIARQMLDYAEAGSGFTLPNTRDPADPSAYAWTFEPPKGNPDVAGVRDYPKDLDREILVGMGIPPEVLEASEVGSGWSGRLVPLLAFYGGIDELVGPVVECFDRGFLRFLVRVNFGPAADYEVEPVSLVEQVKQAGQAKPGGGPAGGGPDQRPGDDDDDGRAKPVPAARPAGRGPRRPEQLSAAWDESKHPREDDGKFRPGGHGAELNGGDSDPVDDEPDEPDEPDEWTAAREAEDDAAEAARDAAVERAEDDHEKAAARREKAREREDAAIEKVRAKEDAKLEAAREREDAKIEKARERANDRRYDAQDKKEEREWDDFERRKAAGGPDFDADTEEKTLRDRWAAEQDAMLAEIDAAESAEDADRQAARDAEDAAIADRREVEDNERQAARDTEDEAADESLGKAIEGIDSQHYDAQQERYSRWEAEDKAVAAKRTPPAPPKRRPEQLSAAPRGPGRTHHRAVLAAMLAVAHRAARRGDPAAAGPALDHLAELADRPNELTAAIAGWPIEMSAGYWDAELHPRDDHGRFVSKDKLHAARTDPAVAAELRSRVTRPAERAKLDKAIGGEADPGRTKKGQRRHEAGERRTRRAEAAKRVREITSRVLTGEADAGHFRELAGHLPHLTVDELRAARVNLAARFDAKAPRKREMVAALVRHAEGMAAAAPPPGPADGGPADGVPADPERGRVYRVHSDDLHMDPERFQYKVSGVRADGVTDEFRGVGWDDQLAGAVLAWRDPDTGKLHPVNGHHRTELRKRTGGGEMNVMVSTAPTAREARAEGALMNLAEGRGTGLDAAKFMRDAGATPDDLRAAGVSLSGRTVADALPLTRLNDAAFQRVADGRLDEKAARAVAKHLTDPDRQEKLFQRIADREDAGKEWTERQTEEAAQAMARVGTVTESGTDLFGDFSNERDTFDQQIELNEYVGRVLNQERADYAAVANQRRADRVSGAGNVLAVDENQRRADAAGRAADVFAALKLRSGPVFEAVKAGAAALADAKTKREKDDARRQTLDAVRAAVAAELAGPARSVAADPGGVDAGGGERPPAPGDGGGPPAAAGEVVGPPARLRSGLVELPPSAPPENQNSYLSPERQLDIFGGSSAQPRPVKPAVQPSLIPPEVNVAADRADDTRRMEGMLDGWKKAAGNEDDAADAADPAPVGSPEWEARMAAAAAREEHPQAAAARADDDARRDAERAAGDDRRKAAEEYRDETERRFDRATEYAKSKRAGAARGVDAAADPAGSKTPARPPAAGQPAEPAHAAAVADWYNGLKSSHHPIAETDSAVRSALTGLSREELAEVARRAGYESLAGERSAKKIAEMLVSNITAMQLSKLKGRQIEGMTPGVDPESKVGPVPTPPARRPG